MRVASKLDLLLERWLRQREKKEIVWITKDKKEIPIQDMTDSHLNNTIRMIKNAEEEYDEYLEALESIGDLEF